MSEVTVQVLKNGPYVIQGRIRLLDSEGNAYEETGEKVALCRCGGSSKKPFCDGTHTKIAFESAPLTKELQRA